MPIPTELKEQNDSDIEVFNYFDTFCDLEHIKEVIWSILLSHTLKAFPGHEVVVSDSSSNVPPFRLSIRRSASKDSINVNSYRLNSSFKSQLPGALRLNNCSHLLIQF